MTYEFDGKAYEEASSHQKEWGAKLITQLRLRGTERVLDLGCGDGTLTAQIAELVPAGKLLGIDVSKNMIEAARPKMRENLEFMLLDINDLTFYDEFDVVYSNAALHWVKNYQRLYKNINRALVQGGRFRFSFAGDGNCAHLIKVIRETISRGEFSDYFSAFEWPWYMPSVDEYSALVASNWPGHACVWVEKADGFFLDMDAMVKWVDQPSLVPFLVHVPEAHKTTFREFVVTRRIEETRRRTVLRDDAPYQYIGHEGMTAEPSSPGNVLPACLTLDIRQRAGRETRIIIQSDSETLDLFKRAESIDSNLIIRNVADHKIIDNLHMQCKRSMLRYPCQTRPISVLIMTGMEDPLIPWEGGETFDATGGRMLGRVLSVPETIEVLVTHNQCSPTPTVTWEPDRDPAGRRIGPT